MYALPHIERMKKPELLVKKNLEWLIDQRGTNPHELQRVTGVPQPTIHRILTGESTDPRTKTLQPLARFFGVCVADLRDRDLTVLPPEVLKLPEAERGKLFARGDGVDYNIYGPYEEQRRGTVRALHPEDPKPDDVVLVPESRIEFSAGPGHVATYELVEAHEPAAYRLSWFQRERINPEKVRRFRVSGDSQEPMLFDGDTILVNTDETTIMDGRLYAIRYGDELRVKYLFRRLDGTLILRSLNPRYPDEEVPAELANEHIAVIGRVRDKSGKGGL